MFASRPYLPVSQRGDSSSDLDSDNDTAFFSTENGSRIWKMNGRPDDLSQDLALDLPYVHPTLPVETKKINYKRRYTCRQFVCSCCLLIVIVAMVTSFAAAIVLGERYITEAPPTEFGSSPPLLPTPTPLVNFTPSDGAVALVPSQNNTTVTNATIVPTTDPNSASRTFQSSTSTEVIKPITITEPSATTGQVTVTTEAKIEKTSHTAAPSMPHHRMQRIFWERKFFPAKSESSIELVDMNSDGVTDVVVILDLSPCVSAVTALDGQFGTKFWQKELNFPAFAVRCELDVNGDGVKDCLVTGRGGGFAAIDRRDGSLLWEVDPTIVFPPYNFYFPLIVSDLNSDGVNDIINMHGGDTSYAPDEHERSPAYLVVVSGKTGQSLMRPMLTPDGHESYMSPVLFKLNGKEDLVLFGSGGETVPGSLWAVSLSSIRTKVIKKQFSHKDEVYKPFINDTYHPCLMRDTDFNEVRPTFDHKAFDFQRPVFVTSSSSYMRFCPSWANVNPIWNIYDVCLYELVRSEVKGVLIPPVLVDLDLDSIDDLVVSTFDGHTIALNGSDASTRLWEVYYPNAEFYSLPVPLYYNKDSIPDLMIRSNSGEWPKYSVSSIKVLDGRNGEELWNFDSAHDSMSSGLSIAATVPGFDAMIFLEVGKLDSNSDQSHSNSYRIRRHGSPISSLNGQQGQTGSVQVEDDYMELLHTHKDPAMLWVSTPEDQFPNPHSDLEGFLSYCGENMEHLTASLWLVTREMVEKGEEIKPLATHKPFLLTLSTAFPTGVKEGGGHAQLVHHTQTKRHGEPAPDAPASVDLLSFKKDQRCAHVAKPVQIVGSPAIGDLNSDGHLEISYGVVWAPITFGAVPTLKVFTFTLEDRFRNVYGLSSADFDLFLPAEQQPWNRYMGRHGNNTYRRII